jgi:anti-sigma factor RsiW
MSCAVEHELTAYLDGELPPFQAKLVENHLGSCQACRATEGLLRGTLSQLSQLPSFAPSAELRRSVLTQIEHQPMGIQAWARDFFKPRLLVPSLGLVAAAWVALVWTQAHRFPFTDPGLYELAANLEIAEDYEVVGLSADDLEVVQHLHELEVQR